MKGMIKGVTGESLSDRFNKLISGY